MSAIAVSIRCHWCSRQLPAFRAHVLQSHQIICEDCLEWHNAALEMLAGEMPRGCQTCRRTWEQLKAETPFVDIRLYVVPRDGIYQLLCVTCVQPYVAKRADLYRGTEFGHETLKIS